MKRKYIVISGIVTAVVLILAVGIGSVFISPAKIFAILGQEIFGISGNVNDVDVSIIWKIRLPRVLLAFFVGAALSASGAVVQSILKNPLASPFTLGVSSGASLGAAIVIATGFTIPFIGNFTLPFFGLAFAIGTVILAVAFASKCDISLKSTTIVLVGMVFSVFMNAVLTLIAGLSLDKSQLILRWQMGNFSGKGWEYVLILLSVFAICITVFLHYSKELDIFSFGEEQASSIGVETKKVKWILLIFTAILTGTAVSFAGVIGFIDLVAPHIVRKIFSSRHKIVVPMSALFGGIFMVVCDLISRTILSPRELPIGVVTAIIGAPFFAYIYLRGKKSAKN
ncbi:MAG: iron ABC transporter permease [Oscillospiraceae bacterium]